MVDLDKRAIDALIRHVACECSENEFHFGVSCLDGDLADDYKIVKQNLNNQKLSR